MTGPCYCPECGDIFEIGVWKTDNPSLKFCSTKCMQVFYKEVPCALTIHHEAHDDCPGIAVEVTDERMES